MTEENMFYTNSEQKEKRKGLMKANIQSIVNK